MNILKKTILLAACLVMGLSGLYAQLRGVGYSTFKITQYKESASKTKDTSKYSRTEDTIYIYKTDSLSINSKKGKLIAVSPDSLPAKFYWSRFDYTSKKYVYLDSDSGLVSTRDTFGSGGIRVHIKSIKHDTIFRAWIFITKLQMSLSKTSKGFLPLGSYICGRYNYIDLAVVPSNDPNLPAKLKYIQTSRFDYVDTANTTKPTISLSNQAKYTWTGEPDAVTEMVNIETGVINRERIEIPKFTKTSTKPSIRFDKNQLKRENALGVNIKFTLNITDGFGSTVTDQVKFSNIFTMADFDVWLGDAKNEVFEKPKDSLIVQEAPLNLRFQNKSRNGASFKWILLDTIIQINTSLNRDSGLFISQDSTGHQRYTYYAPHEYKVKLVSQKGYCTDTSAIKTIKVIDSRIGLSTNKSKLNKKEIEKVFPKYFNPDLMNSNKEKGYFLYKRDTSFFASIRNFQIKIYNQWGTKVYERDEPIGSEWQGWDGNITSGIGLGQPASPGLYYYVYQVEGWGKINNKNIIQSDWIGGYFYLFRKK
jgi:hypothetical protein